jgi:hypothetical protein
MVLDSRRSPQPVLGVLLMTTPASTDELKWTYPTNSPFAGEPLNPKDIQLIKEILEIYPLLTPKKAIEIMWAFGGI